MELRILGTNGPYPAAGGACSGYLLTAGEDRVLFDCGPGVLSRLMARMDPARLTAVVLSHGHADHCSDMMALRYYLDIRKQQDGIGPLAVYAPEDPSSPALRFLKESEVFGMIAIQPGDKLSIGNLTVACGPARHPVPAVGLRVGALGYTGDTNTLDTLADFYRGVSVLVADGCFLRAQWKEAAPHMAAFEAAELARDAGAGKLVITHLRPDVDEHTLLKEASEVFPNAILARPDMLLTL